jgi:hypothetical protein
MACTSRCFPLENRHQASRKGTPRLTDKLSRDLHGVADGILCRRDGEERERGSPSLASHLGHVRGEILASGTCGLNGLEWPNNVESASRQAAALRYSAK